MQATRVLRMFRPTARMMRPVPKEEQAAHTVSQRLRRIKRIPPELFPLGAVVAFAVCAAVYSSTRHLRVDKTIRLKRQNRQPDHHDAHGAEHGEAHGEAKH